MREKRVKKCKFKSIVVMCSFILHLQTTFMWTDVREARQHIAFLKIFQSILYMTFNCLQITLRTTEQTIKLIVAYCFYNSLTRLTVCRLQQV